MDTSLLDKIITLAHTDEDIRVVILEGSMAVHFQVDELSDYDINIYTRNIDKYITNDEWLGQLGEVLLYQKEQFQFYEDTVPTKLVLFRDKKRIDFSFWRLTILDEIVRGNKAYESYKNGYQVLVDKDRLTAQLPLADGTGFSISPPNHESFRQTLYDFWFEAYCIARYLWRSDLWYAKLLENRYIKDRLFQMALWNHEARKEWKPDRMLHIGGKRFEQWASTDLTEAVAGCFSVYNMDETWKSLFAMVKLFNQLARQTSLHLQIEYPDRIEAEILDYLQHLQERRGNREDRLR